MSVAAKSRKAGMVALLWLFYLGVLLFAALPRGLSTPAPKGMGMYWKGQFSLWADTDAWIRAFGGSDPASYAKGGQEIVTHGWVNAPFYAMVWPPGEYLVHAVLQRLNAPIPLSLILLSCLLWACVFLQVFCFARRRLHPLLAAVLPLATLATELMRLFFLHGWGPYLSEGPSCALIILAFGFLVLALEPLAWPVRSEAEKKPLPQPPPRNGEGAKSASGSPSALPRSLGGGWGEGFLLTRSASGDLRRTLWAGCCSGLCFAGSAYFRTHAELILVLLSLIFLAAALVSVLVALRRSGLRPAVLWGNLRVGWWKSGLLAVAVVVLSFHAATMPYRVLHNHRKYGSWQWTPGYSYVWALMWRNPAVAPPRGTFFVQGGGHAPGILAPDWHVDAGRLTPQQARALTLKLIRKRPGAWFGYKLPILSQYWFARSRLVCALRRDGTVAVRFGYSYWENGAILLCLLGTAGGSIVCLFRARFAGPALWLLAFITCVAVGSILPSLLLHFEVRYLHHLKVIGVFLLPYSVAFLLRPRVSAQAKESFHDNAIPVRPQFERMAA